MKTELRLKLKDDTMSKPLSMFLDSWLNDVCEDEFIIVDHTVIFNHAEDAIVAKLKDVPPILSPYVGFGGHV